MLGFTHQWKGSSAVSVLRIVPGAVHVHRPWSQGWHTQESLDLSCKRETRSYDSSQPLFRALSSWELSFQFVAYLLRALGD